MNSGPDADLVSQLGSVDDVIARGAFEHLVARYYSEMLSYLTRATGSRETGEDALQEIFLRLWRSRTRLDIPAGFKPYLYTAARNQARNHARGERRGVDALSSYTAEVGEAAGELPGAAVERAELITAVRSAVAELPAGAREVWRLHREQGLSYAEVASVLGISVNTVKTQMGRALRAVRLAAAPFLTLVLTSRL